MREKLQCLLIQRKPVILEKEYCVAMIETRVIKCVIVYLTIKGKRQGESVQKIFFEDADSENLQVRGKKHILN